DYRNALHLFPPKESQWTAKALTCSAVNNEGIESIWEQIIKYEAQTKTNQYFEDNRQKQAKYWLIASINQGLQAAFYQHPTVKKELITIEKAVLDNQLSPFQGAEKLLRLFRKS
ncbi:MAG: methylmalonyl Co-A mutase-associated GTPase MeaB, partial [Bacteroidota bacterium]